MTNKVRALLLMVGRTFAHRATRRAIHLGLAVAVVLLVVLGPAPARLQRRAHGCFGGNFGNRVGGVFIDPAGAVTRLDKSARIPVRDALRKIHTAAPAGLNLPAEMR